MIECSVPPANQLVIQTTYPMEIACVQTSRSLISFALRGKGTQPVSAEAKGIGDVSTQAR